MIKNSTRHGNDSILYQRDGKICFVLLILGFSIGCLIGSLIGPGLTYDSWLSDFLGLSKLQNMGVAAAFFHFSRFHLVAFLLGSSFFGIVLIPALSCIRGYVLSFTAASIISAYPQNGLIMAAVILGIPALISLPCYFLLSIEGFRSAARIFHLVRGNSSPRKDRLLTCSLACLPFLAAGTLAELKLVPYLISLLT